MIGDISIRVAYTLQATDLRNLKSLKRLKCTLIDHILNLNGIYVYINLYI